MTLLQFYVYKILCHKSHATHGSLCNIHICISEKVFISEVVTEELAHDLHSLYCHSSVSLPGLDDTIHISLYQHLLAHLMKSILAFMYWPDYNSIFYGVE